MNKKLCIAAALFSCAQSAVALPDLNAWLKTATANIAIATLKHTYTACNQLGHVWLRLGSFVSQRPATAAGYAASAFLAKKAVQRGYLKSACASLAHFAKSHALAATGIVAGTTAALAATTYFNRVPSWVKSPANTIWADAQTVGKTVWSNKHAMATLIGASALGWWHDYRAEQRRMRDLAAAIAEAQQ